MFYYFMNVLVAFYMVDRAYQSAALCVDKDKVKRG